MSGCLVLVPDRDDYQRSQMMAKRSMTYNRTFGGPPLRDDRPPAYSEMMGYITYYCAVKETLLWVYLAEGSSTYTATPEFAIHQWSCLSAIGKSCPPCYQPPKHDDTSLIQQFPILFPLSVARLGHASDSSASSKAMFIATTRFYTRPSTRVYMPRDDIYTEKDMRPFLPRLLTTNSVAGTNRLPAMHRNCSFSPASDTKFAVAVVASSVGKATTYFTASVIVIAVNLCDVGVEYALREVEEEQDYERITKEYEIDDNGSPEQKVQTLDCPPLGGPKKIPIFGHLSLEKHAVTRYAISRSSLHEVEPSFRADVVLQSMTGACTNRYTIRDALLFTQCITYVAYNLFEDLISFHDKYELLDARMSAKLVGGIKLTVLGMHIPGVPVSSHAKSALLIPREEAFRVQHLDVTLRRISMGLSFTPQHSTKKTSLNCLPSNATSLHPHNQRIDTYQQTILHSRSINNAPNDGRQDRRGARLLGEYATGFLGRSADPVLGEKSDCV
ncbi:hypothetical protein BDZ89DRAFT_1230433 [Hymenopellis radicata]|nr:hypothetical protein BDZ89DRAFT_1230433 [Hymenopellis radicata]